MSVVDLKWKLALRNFTHGPSPKEREATAIQELKNVKKPRLNIEPGLFVVAYRQAPLFIGEAPGVVHGLNSVLQLPSRAVAADALHVFKQRLKERI